MKQITKYVCGLCGKEFLFKTDCEAHEAMHYVINWIHTNHTYQTDKPQPPQRECYHPT